MKVTMNKTSLDAYMKKTIECEVEEGEMEDNAVNGGDDEKVEVDSEGVFTIDKIANRMKKINLKF